MLLQNVRIHENWQDRNRARQSIDSRVWRLAWLALAASLVIAWAARIDPLLSRQDPLLYEGLMSALFLCVGACRFLRFSRFSARWLAVIFLALAAGLFADVLITPRLVSGGLLDAFISLLIGLGLLILPGWGAVLWLLERRRELFRERGPDWWLTRIGYGFAGGMAIVVWMLLSDSFSGRSVSYPHLLLPVFVRYTAFVIGWRAAAEELFFRGIFFRYLRVQGRRGFWTTTALTLLLAAPIYFLEMPQLQSAETMALYWTGFGLMTVVDSALFVRNDSMVAPIISNGLFQIASFVMGLR